MLKIRRPLGRLIFNMGIAIPGKTVFLIETAPWPHVAGTFEKSGFTHSATYENRELSFMPILSSLAASEFAVTTTSDAASDGKVSITANLIFQGQYCIQNGSSAPSPLDQCLLTSDINAVVRRLGNLEKWCWHSVSAWGRLWLPTPKGTFLCRGRFIIPIWPASDCSKRQFYCYTSWWTMITDLSSFLAPYAKNQPVKQVDAQHNKLRPENTILNECPNQHVLSNTLLTLNTCINALGPLLYLYEIHSWLWTPYTLQGCFTGTGAIVWLPQCQWSNPEGYV